MKLPGNKSEQGRKLFDNLESWWWRWQSCGGVGGDMTAVQARSGVHMECFHYQSVERSVGLRQFSGNNNFVSHHRILYLQHQVPQAPAGVDNDVLVSHGHLVQGVGLVHHRLHPLVLDTCL